MIQLCSASWGLARVRLPEERWPKGWRGKYKDPVVNLVLALYGHPDSGGFWEQHCENMLKEAGFHLVFPAAWLSLLPSRP